MKIVEHNIQVEKTGRYYSNKSISEKVENLWFVIHGYAQLAKNFINEFNFLSDSNTLIIAPEGLSRFYFRDKIGASWMTKEDRENEINDYLNYLDKVLKTADLTTAKINLLGFSQGVHTAVRFFLNNDFYFNNLLLCSSDFPKDVDFVKLKQKLEKSKMFYIFGNEDKSISWKSFKESISLLEDNDMNFEIINFHGGHIINEQSLKRFL